MDEQWNVRNLLGALARRTLTRVRRRDHVILLTPAKIGLGNFLFIWLQVMVRREQGIECWATQTEPMRPWLDQFPAVRELLISPTALPFRASRSHGYYQGMDVDHTHEQVLRFCREFLGGDAQFERVVAERSVSRDAVVVNVRRGDYYSVPQHRGNYSFDISEYVRAAMDRMDERAPVGDVVVVSDSPEWCRIKLGWLADRYPSVVFPDEGPVDDFARLAGAHRLVLANSSFSYWGAYVAEARNPDAHVIAPRFHARHIGWGQLFQGAPTWDIIEDIPGGWDG